MKWNAGYAKGISFWNCKLNCELVRLCQAREMPQGQTRKETTGQISYRTVCWIKGTKTVSSTWDQVTAPRFYFSSRREFGKWVWSSSKNWPEQKPATQSEIQYWHFQKRFCSGQIEETHLYVNRISIVYSFILHLLLNPRCTPFFLWNNLYFCWIYIIFLSAESHRDKKSSCCKIPLSFLTRTLKMWNDSCRDIKAMFCWSV